jgi:hypothetical protein
MTKRQSRRCRITGFFGEAATAALASSIIALILGIDDGVTDDVCGGLSLFVLLLSIPITQSEALFWVGQTHQCCHLAVHLMEYPLIV